MCYPLAVSQAVPIHGEEYVVWKTKGINEKFVAKARTVGEACWGIRGPKHIPMHPTDLYVPARDVFESEHDHSLGVKNEDPLDALDPYDPLDWSEPGQL